jgi:hypothetical protein
VTISKAERALQQRQIGEKEQIRSGLVTFSSCNNPEKGREQGCGAGLSSTYLQTKISSPKATVEITKLLCVSFRTINGASDTVWESARHIHTPSTHAAYHVDKRMVNPPSSTTTRASIRQSKDLPDDITILPFNDHSEPFQFRPAPMADEDMAVVVRRLGIIWP